jgi:uncharacterized repeat protein (TIGR04076 family)
MIKQLNYVSVCRAHSQNKVGKDFKYDELFPDGICPRLYHTLYPYFLAVENGAWQDGIGAGCSAPVGCSCWVRKGEGKVVYAEVVSPCKRHVVGQKFTFMNTRRDSFMCAAIVHEAYPYIMDRLDIPDCGTKDVLACPDWKNVILVELPSDPWYTRLMRYCFPRLDVVLTIIITLLFILAFTWMT